MPTLKRPELRVRVEELVEINRKYELDMDFDSVSGLRERSGLTVYVSESVRPSAP